jgi:heme A synthase
MAVAGTTNLLTHPSRVHAWFRGLSVLATLSVFALVVLGGIVRVTGSGLGCPDWPLCHGGILPPLELKPMIEFSHRLAASFLVGPLVVITCGVAWVAYRRERWLVFPATIALLLLLAQALLGGATVTNELPGAAVAAHLALGEALLACLVLISVVAHRGPLSFGSPNRAMGQPDRFPLLAVASAAAVYLLLISGSYVTVSGATGACFDWPLCQGDVLPEQRLQVIHMAHRFAAVFFGLFVLYTLHIGFRQRQRPLNVRLLSIAVAAALVAQVMVGAANVWLDFAVELRALHQATATAVWGGMAGLAALSLTGPALSQRGASQ